MLVYSQSTGKLTDFATGKVLASGYSGKGAGRNNPDMQDVRAVGPIPLGYWRIGATYNSANTGPVTIPLYKLDDNPGDDIDDATKRSAFRIHGDNLKGDASLGCIIINRVARESIPLTRAEILRVVR